jgi:preprotein translocase subunit SecD
MSSTRRPSAALLALLAVVAAACASADNGSAATAEQNDVVSVTLRPVLGCSPAATDASIPTVGDPANPAGMVVLTTNGGETCQLGPTAVTGKVFAGDAKASAVGETEEWVVDVSIRAGKQGADLVNIVAAQCYRKASACASGEMALVVDGMLLVKATVSTPTFQGSLQIGGGLNETQAKALAEALNHSTG